MTFATVLLNMVKNFVHMSPRRGRAIEALWREGVSRSRIASEVAVHRSTVSRYLAKISAPEGQKAPSKRGRKQLLDDRAQRALVRKAKKERRTSLKDLSSSVGISKGTARTVLSRFGIAKRKAAIKPFLSMAQRQKRLDWCREHQHWTVQEWMKVIWSDEASVQIGKDAETTWVFRDRRERFHPDCLKPSFKSNRSSIMVWACFHGDTRSELQCFDKGSIDAKIYQQVLQKGLLSVIDEEEGLFDSQLTPSSLIFQQDNAAIHTASTTRQFLKQWNIRSLSWPANSPDLNPIENCWTLLKREFHRRWLALRGPGGRTISRADLCLVLQESWKSIDSAVLISLVESMPRRVQAVLKAKGGHVKY